MRVMIIKKCVIIYRYNYFYMSVTSVPHNESEQAEEVEGYDKALARIKSRVSEKHILYPLLEKYFQNKALVFNRKQ